MLQNDPRLVLLYTLGHHVQDVVLQVSILIVSATDGLSNGNRGYGREESIGGNQANAYHDSSTQLKVEVRLDPLLGHRLGNTLQSHHYGSVTSSRYSERRHNNIKGIVFYNYVQNVQWGEGGG